MITVQQRRLVAGARDAIEPDLAGHVPVVVLEVVVHVDRLGVAQLPARHVLLLPAPLHVTDRAPFAGVENFQAAPHPAGPARVVTRNEPDWRP